MKANSTIQHILTPHKLQIRLIVGATIKPHLHLSSKHLILSLLPKQKWIATSHCGEAITVASPWENNYNLINFPSQTELKNYSSYKCTLSNKE